MREMYHLTPIMVFLLPFFGAALILLTGKRQLLRDFWTIVVSIGTFLLVASLVPDIIKNGAVEYHLLKFYPGLSLKIKVDAFGLTFALLSSFLWIVVSFYAIGYMRSLREHNETRFFASFSTAMGGAIGVALSGNLFTLYMFYEILTISTYPLVAHKETEEARKAGRKYLAYLLSGAAFVLFSMAATYFLTGTLDFQSGGFIRPQGNENLLKIIFISFVIGFGTKAAIMPLHEWLPSAMVAPTPVSALLHAVAVVKAGVFCVLRVILYVFGPEALSYLNLPFIFAIIVSFTVIFSNIIAISQDNLKRRLAFSTVNNLSIIILGGIMLSPMGVIGAMLHLVFHGFMKITLFMCAGAIFVRTGKELVSQLEGIGAKMPFTMAAFTVGALGLIGIPPVAGFLSKWFLCMGAIEGRTWGFLLVFLLSALLDAVYFLPIIYEAFFKKRPYEKSSLQEAPASLVVPLVITALASVALFIFPDTFYLLAEEVAKSIFPGRVK